MKQNVFYNEGVFYFPSFFTISALARVVDDESSVTNSLINSYAVKKVMPNDLIALAVEVQRADEEVRHMVSGKLQIIAEQIRFLQDQVSV